MGDDPANYRNGANAKEKFWNWLFSQGASTVLLVLILGFLGYGALMVVPGVLEKHSAELKQAREDYKANLAEQRKDFVDAIKDCCDGYDRRRAAAN